MPPTLSGLRRALDAFHRPAAARVIDAFSPIAGPQFRDEFNLAGHWTAWHALGTTPSSLWGIDRCLRIRETVDHYHSRLFHMAVYARSIAPSRPAAAPWHDAQFHALQRATLDQFLALVDVLGIDRSRLQASCFGGTTVGGHPDGVDRLLRRSYRLPPDRTSLAALRRGGVAPIVVPAIVNLFLQPYDGSLIGPRLEFFCDGLEFATIVFACARVRRGAIEPCHYVGAYGLGVERVLSSLTRRDFLHSVPRYDRARRMLERRLRDAGVPALRREVTHILFGLEALSVLPARLSPARHRLVREMEHELKRYILNLGLTYAEVQRLYRFFRAHPDL
jgi:hypothetical protein